MSPYQHGEVFVTDDGAETDLDLGHYERFTGVPARASDTVSAGRIYWTVLTRERQGDYLGGTVQVIPHVTNAIKEFIENDTEGADIVLCEIGGTVGDIEGLPFFEAIRQFALEHEPQQCCFIHVTLVPWIPSAQELKTKPTQHSVAALRAIGIQPDILLARADRPIPEDARRKIALQCSVRPEAVIPALDCASIYEVPISYHEEGLDTQLLRALGLPDERRPDLAAWRQIVSRLHRPEGEVVGGRGRQVHGPVRRLQVAQRGPGPWRHRQQCPGQPALDRRRGVRPLRPDRPAARHERGAGAGRLRRARRRGQDRGRHLRPREGAAVPGHLLRHAARLRRGGAPDGPERRLLDRVRPVRRPDRRPDDRVGAGRRSCSGAASATISAARCGWAPIPACWSRAAWSRRSMAACRAISERHRHRYEVNINYRPVLEGAGLRFSGMSPDGRLPEMIELPGHPWFVGVQFHPELKSRPMAPHPLFAAFIRAAVEQSRLV